MRKKDKMSLKELDLDMLTKEISQVREKLAGMTISRYTKPSKNVRESKNLRQRLAIVLTLKKEKELIHG